MAVDGSWAAVLLPCGRDGVDAWDRAGEPADDHERTCVYCGQVRAEHDDVALATRGYLDEPVAAPDTLFGRVMAGVRVGLHDREPIELAGPAGPVRIDARTAETVIRWSLDRMGDVQVQRCAVAFSARPPLIDVQVDVRTRAGSAIEPLLADLRDRMRSLAADLLSVPVGRIDVEVTDLFGEPEGR